MGTSQRIRQIIQETGRILPNETYVKLMDEVEAVVTRAQDDKFDAETFMTYIPERVLGKKFLHRTTLVPTPALATSARQPPNC